jgi:hypothetical protein
MLQSQGVALAMGVGCSSRVGSDDVTAVVVVVPVLAQLSERRRGGVELEPAVADAFTLSLYHDVSLKPEGPSGGGGVVARYSGRPSDPRRSRIRAQHR